MKRLGLRLQELRIERNLTAKTVAQNIGVAASTYRAWEAGRAIQGEAPYLGLSRFYGVTLYELLTGERPNKAEAQDAVDRIERELSKLKSALFRSI